MGYKIKDSMAKFNDIYENYGIIGLKIYFSKYFIAPKFVFSSFKGIKNMKNHNFYLKFDDNRINGFLNSNNTGYFIFGEEIVDDENERNNIKYTKARERLDTVNWDLAFGDLISISKENKSIEFRPEYKHKINGEEYYGYMCDTRSELFMEKLNSKFPRLNI